MRCDPRAPRDYVLVKGSYLLGCRVGELARLKWEDVERLSDGGQIHLFGKGSKSRVVRVSGDTLALFESLGRGEDESYLFPSPRHKAHLSRQAIGDVFRKWGRAAGFHLHPHQLRHSHASCSSEGHGRIHASSDPRSSSSATTGHYLAANPRDSSSLRLG